MKYIKFFLVLGILARLALAEDQSVYSSTLDIIFSQAEVHLEQLDKTISCKVENTLLGNKNVDFTDKEKLKSVCEEVAGLLFFGAPLTNAETKTFVGLDGVDKADAGYGFRESDGSIEDERMMIREVTLAGFLGQHYREMFTKDGANAKDIIDYFKLDRVVEEDEREHVAHVLRLMQIAAGKSVSWNGTNFGDELVGEDVVEFYAQHAMVGRFKYLAATKFIPQSPMGDLRDKLKFSTLSMDSIKGEAFALFLQIETFEENEFGEETDATLDPDVIKITIDEAFEDIEIFDQKTIDYNKSLRQELKTTFPDEANVLVDPEKSIVIRLFANEYAKFAEKNNYSHRYLEFLKILPLLYQDYNYLSDNYNTKEEVEKVAPSYFRALEQIKAKDVGQGGVSLGSLQFLPVSIFGLHSLKRLTIAGLENKPDDEVLEKLGNLTELSELSLQNCGLESLPASIGNLKKLRILNFQYNSLKYLPESIGDLGALLSLVLDNNELSKLPESIGMLHGMEELIVSNNKLKTFPVSIGKLAKIKYIYAFDNQIESLPDEIGDCGTLLTLALENNNLTALPETISSLDKLKALAIENNRLTEIPQSVLNMPNLKDLDQQLKIQKKQ